MPEEGRLQGEVGRVCLCVLGDIAIMRNLALRKMLLSGIYPLIPPCRWCPLSP